jgi:hypothetical protein
MYVIFKILPKKTSQQAKIRPTWLVTLMIAPHFAFPSLLAIVHSIICSALAFTACCWLVNIFLR